MPKKGWPIAFVLVMAMAVTLVGSGAARAQLSDTTAFLAHVSSQYRVVPMWCITSLATMKTSSTCTYRPTQVAPRRC